jgi:TIR domain
MSDIFISYSSKDRPWVDTFAKVLEAHGWSVWWDRQIPTGGSFNAVIRQELSAASCAIVVWSEQSVDSEWVQAEADEARKQEKYLPIRIDESTIPLGFTQRTFQSLVDWEPDADHPGFSQLLKDIERLVKSPPRHIAIGLKPWWKRVHPLWFVTLPTALTAAVAIGLMLWPIPARILVNLTTERIEFVVETTPSQGKPILGPLDVRSVAIEKFTAMTFEPETLEVADPSQYQVETDDFPSTAWKPLNVTGLTTVTLAAKDSTRHPRVTVEGLNRNEQKTFHLDAMAVAPGAHVTLEARSGKNGGLNEGLTVKVAGQEHVSLSFREPLKLVADHSELRGLGDQPFQRYDELTYRVHLQERASGIEVAASPDGPILSPTFASGQSTISIFSRIPVTTLDFTKQEPSGERVSALTGEGTMTFPDYPHLGTVPIKKNEAIGLEQLDRFTIQEISLTAKASGMHLVADGMAKQIRTKTGQIPIEHRLTAFDVLWHSQKLTGLAIIVVWMFPTTLGAYRLWKEFKR